MAEGTKARTRERDRDLPKAATVKKRRDVKVGNGRVHLHLENYFWDALAEIAEWTGRSRAAIIRQIYEQHNGAVNMSAEMRVFVLEFYLERNGLR